MEIAFNAGFNAVQIASLAVGTLLPIVVGLVTTKVTGANVKAVVLALLTAVSGFLTEFISAATGGQVFQVDQALLTWLMTFVVAVAVHYGFWKPVGVTEKAQGTLVTSGTRKKRQGGYGLLQVLAAVVIFGLAVVGLIAVLR